MIIISHRGNIDGINHSTENTIPQVRLALNKGFDVEIDVWKLDGKWFLGHDAPVHEVTEHFIKHDKLWCHAKNIEALVAMRKLGIHCFWHEEDSYTLTSKGYIWIHAHYGKPIEDGVLVLVGKPEVKIYSHMGICTDYPTFFR